MPYSLASRMGAGRFGGRAVRTRLLASAVAGGAGHFSAQQAPGADLSLRDLDAAFDLGFVTWPVRSGRHNAEAAVNGKV
jgi:hypothetical protein